MSATSEPAEWICLATNLGLEILSAACDQASSPRRPHYALFGMLLAIAAVFISVGELIYRGKRESVVLRRWGMLWWFYHPSPRQTPFGTLPDIYGLVAGISQCICSIVQYVYCLRHADSPLKASLLPAIFLICLVGSRLSNKRTNANIEQQEQLRQRRLGEPQEQLRHRWLGEPQEQEQLRQRMNINTTDNMDSSENSSSMEDASWHAIKADFLYDQEVEVEGNIEERQRRVREQLLPQWRVKEQFLPPRRTLVKKSIMRGLL